VTLRQILAMTHGYPDYLALEEFSKLSARPTTAENIVALVVDRPLEFKPGAKWDYSNTGYVLLQMVIEKLSGMSYEDFLQGRIFGPLGMTSTYLRGSEDKTPDVAKEYMSFALGPWEDAPAWNYTWFGAAGAMISTPADLVKWNAGLDGGKLLSSRSLQQMLTPMQLKRNPDYGLGIIITKLANGHRMIYHGGNTAGSSSQNARFPDDNLAIILMANSKTFEYNDAVKAVYSVLVPSSPETPTNEADEAPVPPGPNADSAHAREAKAWLEDAINGRIDDKKARSDFRDQLTPAHRAALGELGKLGPRTYDLISIDNRTGTTFYLFLVKADRRRSCMSLRATTNWGPPRRILRSSSDSFSRMRRAVLPPRPARCCPERPSSTWKW
jgi:CubicO group peptidase (beta-lactamase class C family)